MSTVSVAALCKLYRGPVIRDAAHRNCNVSINAAHMQVHGQRHHKMLRLWSARSSCSYCRRHAAAGTHRACDLRRLCGRSAKG